MRIFISVTLLLALANCSTAVTAGPTLESNEDIALEGDTADGDAAPEAADSATNALAACLGSRGEPQIPTAPPVGGGVCRTTSVVGEARSELRVTREGGLRIETITTTQDGVVVGRAISRFRGDVLISDFRENPTVEHNEQEPLTYGQPSAWTTEYTYDSQGRLTRLSRDNAIDGTIDYQVVTEFGTNGKVLSRRTLGWAFGSGPEQVELFDTEGRQTSLSVESSVRTWVYTGLTEIEQGTESGVVMDRTTRTKRADGKLLTFTTSRRASATSPLALSESGSFEYDSAGTLRIERGSRVVNGFTRNTRKEYDAQARQTYGLETSEDASCSRYEQRFSFSRAVERSETTCNGRAFASYVKTLNSDGQPRRLDSVWNSTNNANQREFTTYSYDRCGRLTSMTHGYTTGPLASSPAVTTRYGYDSRGRLTTNNGIRITYDSRGRITSDGLTNVTYCN